MVGVVDTVRLPDGSFKAWYAISRGEYATLNIAERVHYLMAKTEWILQQRKTAEVG